VNSNLGDHAPIESRLTGKGINMTRYWNFLRCAAVLILSAVGITRTAGQEILITSALGNSWDPLIGGNPFFLFPSETQSFAIGVMNNPFAPPFTGTVHLQVDCCKDLLSRTAVTPSGLSVQIQPLRCPPRRPCTVLPNNNVNVGPTLEGRAFVRATTSGTAAPGGYIATVSAVSALGTSSKEIFVNVLPASWPADGPVPICAPAAVSVISLASLTPTPFVWKRTHLASTSYVGAVAFAAPNSAGGLQYTIVNLSTGPIAPTVALVSFKNTKGWPVGIRTTDSRNCGAPSQQVVVAEGETKSFSFSATSTTTLVFSKSTCRVWNVGDCWGRTALGLDDIVAFSEGPFWGLFGGRKVLIETVGDWGSIGR
jgi:hypothetical protein